MDSNGMLENLSYVMALAASCLVMIPLGLNRETFDGNCMLFGEVDLLTHSVTSGDQMYCSFPFYSSLANIIVATLLLFFKLCCFLKSDRPRCVVLRGIFFS